MVLPEDSLADWISAQCEGASRYLFGVAGPPGSGKSTIADRLGVTFGAPVVAMDGFHLSNAELDRRGQRGIKGAPETFASRAFVDLVRNLRAPSNDVWCPAFDRTIDEPIPDQIRVGPEHGLVIVEGNYLLLDQPPWGELCDLFDAVAYLDVPDAVRVRRLIERHVAFGRERADAAVFVERSDAANARLVEASRARSTVQVAVTP